MISILAQERLLGAALGSVFAGVVVYEQRRAIYDSISANSPSQSQRKSVGVIVPDDLTQHTRQSAFTIHLEASSYGPYRYQYLGRVNMTGLRSIDCRYFLKDFMLLDFLEKRSFCLCVSEPLFGKKSRQQMAHYWNKAVDQTLGPIIASLSSRGW
ncbi:hypothetical protein RJ641_033070 [Dillenia turbinata]|uniref:Uncharacterized protein n=1 Tax=Dillenia turbinata TaxID=194707 RepID=A0AAN8VKV3_9MAGN